MRLQKRNLSMWQCCVVSQGLFFFSFGFRDSERQSVAIMFYMAPAFAAIAEMATSKTFDSWLSVLCIVGSLFLVAFESIYARGNNSCERLDST